MILDSIVAGRMIVHIIEPEEVSRIAFRHLFICQPAELEVDQEEREFALT